MSKINVTEEIGMEIQLFRTRKKISQQQLSDALGWGSSGQMMISRLERGATRVDENKLKILLDFIRQEARNVQEEQKVAGFQSDYRQVPEYNVRVSAGPGMFQDSEHIKRQVQIARQWLPTNGKIGLVQVEGDSMFPTINHGDLVAVEFESGYTSDGLYLIRVEDSAFVKRLQREFGCIRIISDNPQYREMTVSPNDGSEFSLIGRVCLIIRKT